MSTIPLLHFFDVLCAFRSSPFQCGFDWGNKKKSVGDKSGEYWGWLILESFVLPKTALLVLQCEVSHCLAGGTSFLFAETDILLHKFFEPNKTVLPHNILYSPSDLMEQILCEWFPDRQMWPTSLCFSTLQIKICCGLGSAIPFFVFLFRDRTGNIRSHHPLQLNQARNDHPPIE